MEQKNNMEVLAKKIQKNRDIKSKSKAKKVKLAKRILIGLAFLILVSLMVKGIDSGVKWFRENTIIVKSPIVIKKQKMVEILSLQEVYRREQNERTIDEITQRVTEEYLNPKVEVSKDCKITTQIDPKQFFETLRVKESSSGKNSNPVALHNYCKAKGMWNEIGYNPQKKFCFKDQEEASLYVAYYVKKNCDNKTQAQCECFWNTGDMTDSCHYSKNELSLAN